MANINQRSRLEKVIYVILNNFFRITGLIYFRFRVRGSHRYPRTGPALICSNHQSHLDPILVGNSCGTRYLSFVARESLFHFKPFGWLLTALGAFPINRDQGLGGIKATLRRLKRGDPVLIFPEGTRTTDGKLQPFKSGFCAIARRSRVPIVPVAIEGAYDAWPKAQPVPSPRQIRLMVGEPIAYEDFKHLTDEELSHQVQNSVEQLLQQLGSSLMDDKGCRDQ